jgi:hypothetical protein
LVLNLLLMRLDLRPVQGIWYALFSNFPLIIIGAVLLVIFLPLLINIFTNPLVSSMYQILAYIIPVLIVVLILALIIRMLTRPRAVSYY